MPRRPTRQKQRLTRSSCGCLSLPEVSRPESYADAQYVTSEIRPSSLWLPSPRSRLLGQIATYYTNRTTGKNWPQCITLLSQCQEFGPGGWKNEATARFSRCAHAERK